MCSGSLDSTPQAPTVQPERVRGIDGPALFVSTKNNPYSAQATTKRLFRRWQVVRTFLEAVPHSRSTAFGASDWPPVDVV